MAEIKHSAGVQKALAEKQQREQQKQLRREALAGIRPIFGVGDDVELNDTDALAVQRIFEAARTRNAALARAAASTPQSRPRFSSIGAARF